MSRSKQLRLTLMAVICAATLAVNADASPVDEEAPGCMGGGPGSVSCGYEFGVPAYGCSVSCNSGYYACCTLNGCTCKKAAAQ